MEFMEKTIKVKIDESICLACESKACIAACKLYARGILALKDGKPVLANPEAGYAERLGTECLGCEYECRIRGKGAITIEAPVAGLEEYRKKHGLS